MDACASRKSRRRLSSRSPSPFSQERPPRRPAQLTGVSLAPEATPPPPRGLRHLSSSCTHPTGSQVHSLSRSAQLEALKPLPEASPPQKRSARSAGRSPSPSQAYGNPKAAVRRSAFAYSLSSASPTQSASQDPNQEGPSLHCWESRSPSPNRVQWSPPVSHGASPAGRRPELRSTSPGDRVQWSPRPTHTALSLSVSPPPCSPGPVRSPSRVPSCLHTDTEEEHSVSQEIPPSVMCGQPERPPAIISRSTSASKLSGSPNNPPCGILSSLQLRKPCHELGISLSSWHEFL